MPNASPIGGYPYPALSDAPNAQTFGANLTSALDLTTIPHFTTFALLSLAVPSPTTGQAAWVTEYSCTMVYNGTRWTALGPALIGETTLGSNASTVTFSSIPQHFRHLQLVVRGWISSSNNGSFSSAYYQPFRTLFNGDTSANYNEGFVVYEANLANTAGANGIAQNQYWPPSTPLGTAGGCCGGYLIGNVNTSASGSCVTMINGYTLSAPKAVSGRFSTYNGLNHGTFGWTEGGWNGGAAISSIVLSPTVPSVQFGSGSIFSLYGLG